jgi:DNA mismatch repair protein MutL
MRIRHLPETLVNRIAAGEVIERPAAAVKELVENSLDAGASTLEIDISEGGKSRIIVSDDGEGMSCEELKAALDRHATSKLMDDNLLNIGYLGFRGEALPSIAAVSRMSVKTKSKEGSGWQINVEGGKKFEPLPCGHPTGTQVEVRDLFYATPARLKFLKSERAEFNAVKDTVSRLAMAFPNVAFKFTHNGKTILRFSANSNSSERLSEVIGREFGENSMMIDEMHENIRVSGLAGLPTYSRGNSLHQFLFVNGRPVRDKLLLGALRGAYADVMAHDRYAAAALFIDIPSDQVDVNVHPSKAEVRFRDPSLVRRLIVTSIQNSLREYGRRTATNVIGTLQKSYGRAPSYQGARPTVSAQGNLAEAVHEFYAPVMDIEPSARNHSSCNLPDKDPLGEENYPLGAALGQVHENYIISQTEKGIAIVDQHAAHERLTYEKLKEQYHEGKVTAQLLLTPEIVDTGKDAAEVLLGYSQTFSALGLELESFGPGTISVRSVPEILAGRIEIKRLIEDIIDELEDNKTCKGLEERINSVLSRMSCHGSVRAGRKLNAEEMNHLLRQMEKSPFSGQCNHGRPTYIELKLSDIEKLFGRK